MLIKNYTVCVFLSSSDAVEQKSIKALMDLSDNLITFESRDRSPPHTTNFNLEPACVGATARIYHLPGERCPIFR